MRQYSFLEQFYFYLVAQLIFIGITKSKLNIPFYFSTWKFLLVVYCKNISKTKIHVIKFNANYCNLLEVVYTLDKNLLEKEFHTQNTAELRRTEIRNFIIVYVNNTGVKYTYLTCDSSNMAEFVSKAFVMIAKQL